MTISPHKGFPSNFGQEQCYTSQLFIFLFIFKKNKNWFLNDVSQSHVIYYFEKCIKISNDCDTLFKNKILEKFFKNPSISPWTNPS
jgi:hypothetical protein